MYEQLLRQYSFAKRIQSQTVSTKKLLKTLLYKKAGHKMLVKLTPAREKERQSKKKKKAKAACLSMSPSGLPTFIYLFSHFAKSERN